VRAYVAHLLNASKPTATSSSGMRRSSSTCNIASVGASVPRQSQTRTRNKRITHIYTKRTGVNDEYVCRPSSGSGLLWRSVGGPEGARGGLDRQWMVAAVCVITMSEMSYYSTSNRGRMHERKRERDR
jgi:hypothetical protein